MLLFVEAGKRANPFNSDRPRAGSARRTAGSSGGSSSGSSARPARAGSLRASKSAGTTPSGSRSTTPSSSRSTTPTSTPAAAPRRKKADGDAAAAPKRTPSVKKKAEPAADAPTKRPSIKKTKPDGDSGTPKTKPDGDSGTPKTKPDGDSTAPKAKPDSAQQTSKPDSAGAQPAKRPSIRKAKEPEPEVKKEAEVKPTTRRPETSKDEPPKRPEAEAAKPSMATAKAAATTTTTTAAAAPKAAPAPAPAEEEAGVTLRRNRNTGGSFKRFSLLDKDKLAEDLAKAERQALAKQAQEQQAKDREEQDQREEVRRKKGKKKKKERMRCGERRRCRARKLAIHSPAVPLSFLLLPLLLLLHHHHLSCSPKALANMAKAKERFQRTKRRSLVLTAGSDLLPEAKLLAEADSSLAALQAQIDGGSSSSMTSATQDGTFDHLQRKNEGGGGGGGRRAGAWRRTKSRTCALHLSPSLPPSPPLSLSPVYFLLSFFFLSSFRLLLSSSSLLLLDLDGIIPETPRLRQFQRPKGPAHHKPSRNSWRHSSTGSEHGDAPHSPAAGGDAPDSVAAPDTPSDAAPDEGAAPAEAAKEYATFNFTIVKDGDKGLGFNFVETADGAPGSLAVKKVKPGGAAAVAGLKAGDILLNADDTPLTACSKAEAMAILKEVTDQVQLQVCRERRVRTRRNSTSREHDSPLTAHTSGFERRQQSFKRRVSLRKLSSQHSFDSANSSRTTSPVTSPGGAAPSVNGTAPNGNGTAPNGTTHPTPNGDRAAAQPAPSDAPAPAVEPGSPARSALLARRMSLLENRDDELETESAYPEAQNTAESVLGVGNALADLDAEMASSDDDLSAVRTGVSTSTLPKQHQHDFFDQQLATVRQLIADLSHHDSAGFKREFQEISQIGRSNTALASQVINNFRKEGEGEKRRKDKIVKKEEKEEEEEEEEEEVWI